MYPEIAEPPITSASSALSAMVVVVVLFSGPLFPISHIRSANSRGKALSIAPLAGLICTTHTHSERADRFRASLYEDITWVQFYTRRMSCDNDNGAGVGAGWMAELLHARKCFEIFMMKRHMKSLYFVILLPSTTSFIPPFLRLHHRQGGMLFSNAPSPVSFL